MRSIPITFAHMIDVNWLGQKVAIFKSVKQARKQIASISISPSCPGAAGYATHDNGQTIFWMILSEKNPKLATVAHEAAHVADFLCESAGIPVTVECGEVRAYLIGWLVGEVCRLYGLAV